MAKTGPTPSFRIHPAIGIARVGNSDAYVIAPETMAGHPLPGQSLVGGLPIRAGTESEPITASDLRDSFGRLKRHAARFRIFQYAAEGPESYPNGAGIEIRIGSEVDGRVVEDIVWTVHVANKKANSFALAEDPAKPQGLDSYSSGLLPDIHNPSITEAGAPQPPIDQRVALLNDAERLRKLVIDPGPRVTRGRNAAPVHFDRATPARYFDNATAKIKAITDYPKSFPADSFQNLDEPSGPIDTLGELRTDDQGRLLVLGGYGRAVSWPINGTPATLSQPVNNDQWFDDVSDGPVSATILFADGTTAEVHGAWVTTVDPSFAPQILNVVSCWDEVYDTWVRGFELEPELFDAKLGSYSSSYRPSFDDQIRPIFLSAALQQWVANLSAHGQSAHKVLTEINAESDPASTPLAGIVPLFRDPNNADDYNNLKKMPMHLGDGQQSMLALKQTQFFMLTQWGKGFDYFRAGSGRPLGSGEALDKAALVNCLGGRFSPGIDLTFIVRDTDLYVPDWQTSGGGPFRIRTRALDYASVTPGVPVLTAGYVPKWVYDEGLEPGDVSKFMALPWHTDYNSCATHPPSPNPEGNKTLFWSWPAQRPVAVFLASDVTFHADSSAPNQSGSGDAKTPQLGAQQWSVRGEGTDSSYPQNWGRYQTVRQILDNWHRVGTVLQAPAIDPDGPLGNCPTLFLEAGGQLADTGRTPVEPFPNIAMTTPADALDPSAQASPDNVVDERDLYFKLLNIDAHPEILPVARAYVDSSLAWAQSYSEDPDSPEDQRFFPYTEEALQTRLDWIYQELVDNADASNPGSDPVFRSREDMVTRTIQLAPYNLLDGAWLRNIGNTGPMDEVRALLYSVAMDELGGGDVSRNHCNIYLDLCHSLGYYPPPVNSAAFAQDPQFLDSAFTVPAFELAISQFSQDYYPELLGMTLNLEWEVVDLKGTRDLLEYYGINAHFYIMHIGIDNAVNGHGQRALQAVKLYLQNVRSEGGEDAVQRAWRRIWNGFVAFGNLGTFGHDLQILLTNKPTLRDRMVAMFASKAKYGQANHQDKMVGPSRINEWFSDPSAFVDAMLTYGYITPGDWKNSRIRELLDFETGPMFRVFTDDEIQLWADYTNSLGKEGTGASSPAEVPSTRETTARDMAALLDTLRPMQRGTLGHTRHNLSDATGQSHTLAWWFDQPTSDLMAALADTKNGVITPGDPANSRFYTQLIAPEGPMGWIFAEPAAAPAAGLRRDVVFRWIAAGCPLPAAAARLRLGSPLHKRRMHRSGKIQGMGTLH